MIRRPLNERFASAVLEGRKITTIRDNAWPVGKPIQLFRWEGKAYRSKQVRVAVVMVKGFWPILIGHVPGGAMRYAYGMEIGKPLHETEGFESAEDMDAWFRPLVREGQTITKALMRFEVVPIESSDRATEMKPMKATQHETPLNHAGCPKRVRLFAKEPPLSGSERRPCSLACEDCENVFDATAAVHHHPYLPGGTYLACPTCGSSHLVTANELGMARRDGRPPCQDGLSPSPSPSCSGSSELP